MSLVTLRPDAVFSTSGWTVVGAADAAAALNDNNDATYIKSTGAGRIELNFGTTVLPTLAQVRSVTTRVRGKNQSNTFAKVQHLYVAEGNINGLPASGYWGGPLITFNSTITTYSSPLSWDDPSYITQFDVDSFRWQTDVSKAEARIYEVYLDLVINEAPVASAVAPTGGTQVTSRPTITWTYSDPEGDQQERFQVKIFSAAQYGIGGFNPETSPATYDSGDQLGSGTSFQIDTPLLNGTVYKAYVKVSDVGSNARYGAWVASASSFTVTLNPPNVPTIVVAARNTSQAIEITIDGNDNLLSLNQSSLETDLTGWIVGTNCAIAQSSTFADDGTFSLRLTSSASGDMAARTLAGSSGIAVRGGQVYAAIARFRSAVSARSCRVIMYQYDSSGTYIGGDIIGSSVSDGTGGFTSVTVSGAVQSNCAFVQVEVRVLTTGGASEVHYVDKIGLYEIAAPAAWTVGGLASSVRYYLQRSDDNGLTWNILKRLTFTSLGVATIDSNGKIIPTNKTSQFVDAYDYDVVRGHVYSYRVYAEAENGVSAVSSTFSVPTAASLSLDTTKSKWNMKVLDDHTLDLLNIDMEFANPALNRIRPELSGFFAPITRTKKVKVSDSVQGDEFALKILCKTAATYALAISIIESESTLFVEDPSGRAWYVGVGDPISIDASQLSQLYYQGIKVNCVEVEP